MASASQKFEFKAVVKMPKVDFIAPKGEVGKKFKSRFVGSFQKATLKGEAQISYWLDEAMQESTWNWPGTTFRQNGEVVSSPRNIVDTGELINSKKLSTRFGVTQASYLLTYTAPYAALVHWGGYISPYGRAGDQTYIPGRPWAQLIFREDANEGDSDAFNFLDQIKERMVEDLKDG